MEIKILAAVMNARSHWDSVSPHITYDDLTPEGGLVWKNIKQYYKRDPDASKVDMEVLERRIMRHVESNAKHKASLEIYLQRVKLIDVSALNVVAEVLEQKRTLTGLALADALVAQDKANIDRLMNDLALLNAAADLDIGVEEEHENTDVLELLEAYSPDNLIRVSPPSLNHHLGGGALRGHHIMLAAMPEVGKSLFAIQMAAGFVMQDLKVLYIGNEDPIVSLVFRFLTNLTGMTKYEIIEDPDKARTLAGRRGYGRAVFAGLSPGTLPEIRSLVMKHKPDVLIVDQLRNIQVKSENRTGQLEAVARGMRDFARQYNVLAVSVTQAGDSARGRLVLNMGDIDGSNIGMPGACDVMVMVGMNDDYYASDQRHVSLAKNKLTGDHSSWTAGIDKARSRITDSAEYIKRIEALKEIAPPDKVVSA